MAATSSYQSYLMYKGGSASAYTKLVDIKDYPDLGGTPETIETTTLSDKMQTNILGIQSLDTLEFTCNYDKETFTSLKAIETATVTTPGKFAVWFGADSSSGDPDGSLGKFSWEGQLSVYVSGKGTNEVREMTVSIAASTVISFE